MRKTGGINGNVSKSFRSLIQFNVVIVKTKFGENHLALADLMFIKNVKT